MDEVFSMELTDDMFPGKRKDHVTRFICKNFKKNVDYVCKKQARVNGKHGGSNMIQVFMTPESASLLQNSYNLKHRYMKAIGGLTCKSILMTLENSFIGFVCNSLRSLGIDFHRQFRVGQYYVDLYIPALGLVLECDECGHESYDTAAEQERQCFIEDKLKCAFMRFNPNANDFDLSDVINDIVKVFLQKFPRR